MSTWGLALLLAAGVFVAWSVIVWLVHGGPRVVWGSAPGATRRILLFDGGCGFCRRWLDWSLRRRQWPLESLACQEATQVRAAVGMSEKDCAESAFLVLASPDGSLRVLAGAAAVNGVLAGFRGAGNVGWRLLASAYPLPVVRQVENVAYAWVARNRHRFGSGECSVDVGVSGPRLGRPR